MARTKRKVDDSQLVTMINQEMSSVRTEAFDLLSDQRINSNYSFANQHTDYTVPTTNMSRVNFYFTPSVVNTLTMHQSKIFCSEKDTISFSPAGDNPELLAGAKQLSKMVNTVLHRENPGFDIITEMFRSAAVNKNSVAKVGWEEDKEIQEIEYEELDPIMMDEIVEKFESQGYKVKVKQTGEVTETLEAIEVDAETGVETVIEAETTKANFTLRLERKKGKIGIDVIAPEEFVINEDTTSINNDKLTRFVAQRRQMYRSDVKVMFPKVDVETLASWDALYDEYETMARHAFDGTWNGLNDQEGTDELTNKVTVVESWIRADRDGDGYAEWRHVFSCGSTLLMDEEWFGPLPFSSYTFFPVPHKFYGLSVYDRLKGYEETATGLVRADVDMSRLKNTFRLLAKEGSIEKRSLQSGKPGVIPVSNTFDPSDVMVIPTPQGSGNTTQLLQELRMQVIADVGIDPINGSVSRDIEKSGNDAEKTQMALDNATVKVEGYSRRFAEGTLRDIAWQIAYLLVKYKDEDFVQQVVEAVSPGMPFIIGELGLTTVMDKTDLISKVGLGHQSSQQKVAAAGSLMQLLTALEQNPSAAIYNLVSEAYKGFGYENPGELLGSLQQWKQKAEEQRQKEAQAMQMQQQQLAIQTQEVQHRMQLAEQQFEFEKQIAQMKAESEIRKNEAQAILAEAKAVREGQEQSLEERKFETEAEIEMTQGRAVSIG